MRRRLSVAQQVRIALALAMLVLLPAGPASADAYDAALTRAIAAKEQALDANDPASWEGALSRFLEVRAIAETKEGMYELGLVASRLNQDDLAVEAYGIALELGLSGEPREKARAFVESHGDKMARLRVQGPAGTVIFVAGRQRGVLPIERPLALFPGSVLVRAYLADGRSVERRLTLSRGDATSVTLTVPNPASPAAARGRAEPSAAGMRPPPSRVATTDSSSNAAASVATPAVANSNPEASSGTNTTSNVLLWAGGALAVLSATAVPLAGSQIESARVELDRNCPEPVGDNCPETYPENQVAAQRAADDIATYKGIRTGAWVGVGVGAALFATGLGLRLYGNDAPDTAMHLAVSPGSTRVWLERMF